MKCPRCGANPEVVTSFYCPECGADLPFDRDDNAGRVNVYATAGFVTSCVRQPFWHSTADSLIFICEGFTPDKGDWGRRQGTCGMWYNNNNIRNRSVDTSAPDSGVHDLLG